MLRLFLALATLAVLASPFGVAFYFSYEARWIGPQPPAPNPRIPAAELEQFRDASRTNVQPLGADPIVLGYHDITWNSASHYSVTPTAFAQQMAMLRTAGYRCLTAGQFTRYMHGGSVPSRAVLVTFDDGTKGLWTYADKILQRYDCHGVSFVITGRVGTHQPYYLTWQEIQRMQSSGRWDFESHTNHLHEQVRVSASGRLGDPLTQLIWLPRAHRRETLAQFRIRVSADLHTSISALTSHGLPRPRLFAYPFSEQFGSPPLTAAAYANALISRLFAAAMTNYLEPPVPVSRREAATKIISRLEVVSTTSAQRLFNRLREMASLQDGQAGPLHDNRRWLAENGRQASVATAGRSISFRDNRKTWAYAAYAPGATADWSSYRLAVTAAGLRLPANPTATLSVRLGSPAQLSVSVSNHYVMVSSADLSRRRIRVGRDLLAADSHRIVIVVRPGRTKIMVDGAVLVTLRARRGRGGTGGFALAAFRSDRRRPFPFFTGIACRGIRG